MRVDDERSKEGHLDEGHVEVGESYPGLDVVFVEAENLWVHFFSGLSNTGQHHLRLIDMKENCICYLLLCCRCCKAYSSAACALICSVKLS